MAYFLKKTMNKKGTYLQIYESYYNPERKGGAHRSYKPIGYVLDFKLFLILFMLPLDFIYAASTIVLFQFHPALQVSNGAMPLLFLYIKSFVLSLLPAGILVPIRLFSVV